MLTCVHVEKLRAPECWAKSITHLWVHPKYAPVVFKALHMLLMKQAAVQGKEKGKAHQSMLLDKGRLLKAHTNPVGLQGEAVTNCIIHTLHQNTYVCVHI